MEQKLGLRTRIADAMDFLNGGGNPWIVAGAYIYHLSSEGNPSGMMVYIRYNLADGAANFSIRYPFSYNDTIRSILDNGDNLGLQKQKAPPYPNIEDDPSWELWKDSF